MRCPACGEDKLKKLFGLPNAIVRGSPRTIGQLAEDNTRKLVAKHGKEKANQLIHERSYGKGGKKLKLPSGASATERPKEVETPWFRSGEIEGTGPRSDTPINPTTIKDPVKYIKTGEKT